MSESTGLMTWDAVPDPAGHRSAGPIPGCEVALAEDGEVICRGGNVFRGYLDDPEKTAEALDADGWLHSGDIGVIDDDGYLRIVDRKKELIITAGGKNISPANLEAALKAQPLIGQACVIGDQRPFIVRARGARPRHRAGVGQAQHGHRGHEPRRARRPRRGAGRGRPRGRRGDGVVQQRRAGEEGRRAPRRVAARLGGADADDASSSGAASTPSTRRRSSRSTPAERRAAGPTIRTGTSPV